MAFGRRKREQGEAPAETAEIPEVPEVSEVDDSVAPAIEEEPAPAAWTGEDFGDEGPFDIEDFDDPEQAGMARLDLGSVLVPMPPGGQVQVEFNQVGQPTSVWVVTPNGRFTIAAYAAPKSPGLWREVAAELAQALRGEGASVAIEDGPWGREVTGVGGAGAVRFIGVDGYRWMIRCVANGMPQSMPALVEEAREALADTVVRRGDTPLPVRTPLPVGLPEELAEQLRAAAAQQAQQQAMFAAQQQAMLAAQQQQMMQQQAGGQIDPTGSGMQQVRSTSTGG